MISSSASFLRQLSARESWKPTSNEWSGKERYIISGWGVSVGESVGSVNPMEGFNMHGNEESGVMGRKRVMVVVDGTSHSKHAMLWALTHVTNKGDSLTLLHIVPPLKGPETSSSTYLVNYLGSLCKDCKPGVSWLRLFVASVILCLLLLSFHTLCSNADRKKLCSSWSLIFQCCSIIVE